MNYRILLLWFVLIGMAFVGAGCSGPRGFTFAVNDSCCVFSLAEIGGERPSAFQMRCLHAVFEGPADLRHECHCPPDCRCWIYAKEIRPAYLNALRWHLERKFPDSP